MAAAIGQRGTKILAIIDTTLRIQVSVPKGTQTAGASSCSWYVFEVRQRAGKKREEPFGFAQGKFFCEKFGAVERTRTSTPCGASTSS
jgi:hypothetical protein